MSDQSIPPERAKLIGKRIAQAFAFARDVIDAPVLLEKIPDGSTLLFRDVMFQGLSLRLTAHPSQNHPGWWTARVTGPAELASASLQWTPPIGTHGMGGKWGSPPTYPEDGPTPKDALDSLEAKLRDADRADAVARGA